MPLKFDYAEASKSPILRAEATSRKAVGCEPAPEKVLINLSRGWPAPNLLPTRELNQAADFALSHVNIAVPALQYGPDPGYEPLRISIAKWLAQYYNVEDKPEQICITGGASQNLANILAGFTDPNITKRIWMVTPTYYLASRIFEDAGFAGRLRAVHEDAGGLDVEYLEQELAKLKDEPPRGPPTKTSLPWRKTYSHIIYCVPTFSNPSTRTMKESRRRKLVLLAAKYNALVITDDVYDFLHWPMKETLSAAYTDVSAQRALVPRVIDVERSTTPAPADPDGFGFSISNGSFSKILGPGVRTGWADCSVKLAYGISQVGATKSGGAPSQLTAAFIDLMLRRRHLQEHIAKTLLPSYQQRWVMMMQAVEQALLPAGVTIMKHSLGSKDVFGGYFIWISLPRPISADMVALACLWEHNLVVSQGSLFEVSGDTSLPQDTMLSPFIRLCFAYEPIESLMAGVYCLGEVLIEMQQVSGPMCNAIDIKLITDVFDGVIYTAKTTLAMPQTTIEEKNEFTGQVEVVERMLPSQGAAVRMLYVRGIADDVPEEVASKPFELWKELDGLVRELRCRVFGDDRVSTEQWCAGLHAEVKSRKPSMQLQNIWAPGGRVEEILKRIDDISAAAAKLTL